MEFKQFFDWNKDGLKKPDRIKVKPTYDPDYIQLSTLQVLKILVIDKMLGKKDLAKDYSDWVANQHKIAQQSDPAHNPEPTTIEVFHLAVVLDGEVYDIIRTQKEFADVLLARPEFVLFSPSEKPVLSGMQYKDGEFSGEGKQEHRH
jgi:hypothetical protein